ncbi:MAG: ABC transporter substrate-binding protein [Gracilimonas sp.]
MKKLFLFLLPFFVITSCGKGPETVTVNPDNSDLFGGPDSAAVQADTSDDDFVHIKLGEAAQINSLDPLFAESNSEWRMINLIYDRLVRLDENGEPAPGLAKRWTVNEDSTQYIFHLKTTVSFHNSPVFEGNTGRRFVGSDVKYIFDRMASNDVPNFTAQNFKDITGFSIYHSEQSLVKDPNRRVYSSVEGVRTRDDSTVVFFLNESSGDLLQRLAHPMASVYPKESVESEGGPIQDAAGTGAFRLLYREGNAHLLAINQNYDGPKPDINRLDIISGLTERDLFQEFARTNLHGLIEVGPSTLLTIADTTGNLQDSYYRNYNLEQTDITSEYPLYFNRNSGQAEQLNEVIPSLDQRSLLINPALGTINIDSVDTSTVSSSEGTQFVVTQTKHPFCLFLLNNAAPQATELDYNFSMSASYAPSDEITFTTLPYPGTEEFLNWKTPLYILTRQDVSGIQITHHPWNLDLSELKLNGSN